MRTTLSILLISFFFVGAVASKPKEKTPAPKASFLPKLTALAADPKSQSPSSTEVKSDKSATIYSYADAPPLRGLTVTSSKERPDAWRIRFESTEKIGADSLGVTKVATPSLPDNWFEIGEGPLVGKLLHLREGGGADVTTPTFLLTTSFNFDDRAAMRWACESERGGVKNTITVDNFTTTCRDAVRKRLTRPDTADFHYFGVNHDVRVSKDCEYQWSSDVTAKNAFNAEMKHNFRCSYSPKSGLVESSVD